MSPKLVIFDLDNTLVITQPAAKNAYKQAINFIAKQHGLHHQRTNLYNHWKKIVSMVLGEKKAHLRSFEYSLGLLLTEQKIPDTYLPEALTIYQKELLDKLEPQKGAKELLQWLHEHQVTVAVATESSRAEAKKKLKTAQLWDFIDHMVSVNDVETMKPNTLYYQLILDETKIKPVDTVVVGDKEKEDAAPAKKLKLNTIVVSPTPVNILSLKDPISRYLHLE